MEFRTETEEDVMWNKSSLSIPIIMGWLIPYQLSIVCVKMNVLHTKYLDTSYTQNIYTFAY